MGGKFIPRAPQQHARIAERRGALFRDVIHRSGAQLKVEGLLDIPFGYRLAEAVFAGHPLVTVNTPLLTMQFMAEWLAFFPTWTKQMGMGSSLIRRACHSKGSLETPID